MNGAACRDTLPGGPGEDPLNFNGGQGVGVRSPPLILDDEQVPDGSVNQGHQVHQVGREGGLNGLTPFAQVQVKGLPTVEALIEVEGTLFRPGPHPRVTSDVTLKGRYLSPTKWGSNLVAILPIPTFPSFHFGKIEKWEP